MVSARQRGEPLDVDTEQAREGIRLGLAEGRELLGRVLHRAVPLAQLDARQGAGADGTRGGGEAVAAQQVDERLGPCGRVFAGGCQLSGIPLLDRRHPRASEVGNGLGAGVLGEVLQDFDGERVVVRLERLVSCLGDDVGASGPTPTSASADRLVLHDGPLLDERVEVATDGRRRQVEVSAELGSGDRALGRDHVQDSGSGARLERRAMVSMVTVLRLVRGTLTDKHHTIVT